MHYRHIRDVDAPTYADASEREAVCSILQLARAFGRGRAIANGVGSSRRVTSLVIAVRRVRRGVDSTSSACVSPGGPDARTDAPSAKVVASDCARATAVCVDSRRDAPIVFGTGKALQFGRDAGATGRVMMSGCTRRRGESARGSLAIEERVRKCVASDAVRQDAPTSVSWRSPGAPSASGAVDLSRGHCRVSGSLA
jgi:hypothetical protein